MWGLILGGILGLIAVGLLVEKKVAGTHFVFLVALAAAVGFSVAYYGSTKKVSAGPGGFSWEGFEKQADAIKQKALDDIRTEVADQKTQLSSVIAEAQKTREDLEKVAEAAAPPTLSLESKSEVRKDRDGYTVDLCFVPSKNVPFGKLTFQGEIVEGTEATFKRFDPGGGTQTFGEHTVAADGKKVTDEYWPHEVSPQTLTVTVSAPCKLHISGSHMAEPLEFDIE